MTVPAKIPVQKLIDSNILVINDGYRAKNVELSKCGLPFARAQNINNGFHFDNADYFPVEDIIKVGIKVSRPGDVVFTSKGTVGRLAFVCKDTPKFVYAPQLCFWRSLNHQEIQPRWLYYWMHSSEFFAQYKGVSGQTDMAEYVSLYDQRNMSITVPSLNTQKRIAEILGSLDDKIELNRKQNETLEAMARAVFQSWFVDFDPVIDNAMAAGHPIPDELAERGARRKHRKTKHPLPQAIQSLFPDRFDPSPLGPIPKGWKVSTVGTEFDLTMGQSPPGESYNETGEGIVFYQGRRDFGFRFPMPRVFCSEPKRFAEKSDTLISVRAPVGDVNMANEKSCIGRGVAAARHKSGSRSYTYYMMHHQGDAFNNYDAEGTVFGSISKKDFENMKCLRPNSIIIKMYEEKIFAIDEQIETNEQESKTLTHLRDSLLPKLLTGEIEV